MRYGGWYQIAFEHDLQGDLSSVPVGDRRLLIVRHQGEIQVYDATCPHRGADLGVGGRLIEARVVSCPYHGHRVALGGEGNGPYCVRGYPTLVMGGLIFALIGNFEIGRLPEMLRHLEETRSIFPGFTKTIRVAPETVIENAFDWAHFIPVHGVRDVEHGTPSVEDGVFTARTVLRVGPTLWQGTGGGAPLGAGAPVDDGSFSIDVPLLARAYSPNLTITQVAVGGGDHPHFVIASAVPMLDGTSTIRLSVALPRPPDGGEAPRALADLLLQFESMGLEQDRPVWENLAPAIAARFTAEDENVLLYRKFCERFALGAPPATS
jgi:phenylpropionate dioxygenase-like ring-hydroxylating dioxygenase large terminal subunit